MNITWVGASSNNFNVGRGGKKINKIVLHWIVGTLASADATFANPDRKASAHYGVGETEIHQWVKEEDTAWHASNYGVNQESIGIEHEGGWLLPDGTRKVPTEAVLQNSARLVADICTRYNIPIDREHIHLHNEYSATQCPGLLDANRILELAKQISTPTHPSTDIDTALKLLEEFRAKEGHGNLEGAIRALLSSSEAVAGLKSQLEGLEMAKNKEIATLKEIWHLEVDTANKEIARLTNGLAENLDWKTLFSIAWRKWWAFRRAGE